jgi:hypothetical protein
VDKKSWPVSNVFRPSPHPAGTPTNRSAPQRCAWAAGTSAPLRPWHLCPIPTCGRLVLSWGDLTHGCDTMKGLGCIGDGLARLSTWNPACPGQFGLQWGWALSCNTMTPVITIPDAFFWWWCEGLGEFYNRVLSSWWCQSPWTPALALHWWLGPEFLRWRENECYHDILSAFLVHWKWWRHVSSPAVFYCLWLSVGTRGTQALHGSVRSVTVLSIFRRLLASCLICQCIVVGFEAYAFEYIARIWTWISADWQHLTPLNCMTARWYFFDRISTWNVGI